ncbi:tetratricopeptide repeat protein [Arcicella rigui]|uniref:Tetratricopeptide repeat protein n=1 Tax=Arcicella rigui TaxID=797020 RepID=A0ABU5QCC2_9BACT|nr:tetratricopeptide repeat protein [Arcicella rigui]MEA5140505.1 tetratricopeptide repeat protein [Arcicella rigui]
MNSLQFWKNWQKSSRNLYIFSLSILLFSILTLSFFYFKGLENVVHWDILSELGEVPIILDQFKVGSETLSLPTKTFTVTEQFVASPMAINFIGNYVFLGLLSFAFVLLLSALSALPRFWYLVSMGLVIVFLVTFNLELLYNVANKYFTTALIVLFVGLSYFFHAFRPDIDIAKRFISFFFLTALIALVIFFTAKVNHPFFLLASYRTAGAMLLSTAFIFLVAYEIVNGFLIISTSVKSTQSLQNFLLISLIYLVNVLLVFLHNNKIIDWEMIYLSPFLLIVLSSVLGIWGFKKRTESILDWLNFEKSGAFTYLSLAIFTIATCALAFATSNDPMIEVMEDAITYTHLAMGLMFLLYVLLNFFPLFKQAFEVHKVVFKPLRLPIWTFRVLAIILIAALLVLKGFFTVQQAFAAHYNALGDYYTAEKDYKFAEIEYKMALVYEYRNHKTNYALASLALLQGDNETAAVYFRKSLAKNPSVFAYEGLSRSFYDGEHFFDAMFTLKEGLQKFPKSGELQNNLAYLFNKSNVQDSTVLYYEMAVKNAQKSEVPASNLLAFWANNGKKTAIEELLQQSEDIQYNSYQANKLAMKNIIEKKFSELTDNDFAIDLSSDSVLNASNFAWIYNQTFYQKALGENFDLRRFSEIEENESLSEDLLFANVIQEYYKGDKLITFQNLQAWAVGDSTDKKGKYYQLLLNTFLKKEAVEKVNLAEIKDMIGVGLKQHPLNEAIVSKAVELLNKNRQPEKAYQVVLNAISWRKNSPMLYQLYIQQALTIGMKDYAEDGMKALQKLSPTDYQRFLPTYQAKLASIEKASAGFQ